jgi:hypothetical protein
MLRSTQGTTSRIGGIGQLLALMILGAVLLGPAAARSNTPLPGAIAAQWTEAFSAVRADPKPPKLTRDSHYWVSDEQRHDLFRRTIADKGGIFIGLGTDQNYLMAGWARPEILVPFDFDQMVIDLHFAFRAIFLGAKDRRKFFKMWTREEAEATMELIAKAYADNAERAEDAVRAYKKARRSVHRRLRRVIRTYRRNRIPTYLTNDEQYRFVVNLFATGRVFPVRGDLTREKTLTDISKAARECGLTVRVLYLSNAEQYFRYVGTNFKANMLGLPFDQDSVVIRTVGLRKPWSADGMYEYVVQSGENLWTWMKHPSTYSVWTMVNRRRINKRTGLSKILALPRDR